MCAADSGAVCRGTQQGHVRGGQQGPCAGGHSRGGQRGCTAGGHSRDHSGAVCRGTQQGGEEHRYSIDTVSGY